MIRPMPRPITSWSHSRLSTYEQCPAKLYYQTVLKLPEPKSDAMSRGTEIHGKAEAYLKGLTPKLAPELKLFDKELKRLKTKRKKDQSSVIIEDTWAFLSDWGATRYDDWKNCWLRIKTDVAERDGPRIVVTDWKTGKYRADNRSDYMQQLNLYAVGALTVFQHIPDVQITARLMYVDHGITYPEPAEQNVYTAKDRAPLQKDWAKKVKPLFVDKKFAPKPNQFCNWCHFRKSNGGPCKF